MDTARTARTSNARRTAAKRNTRVGGRLVAVVTMLFGVSCRREQRDFNVGGPREDNMATQAVSPPRLEGNAARGPQTTFEQNAYALSEGKRLYASFNCITCHANGGGDIGPALIDSRWFYGASPADVYASIMDGRPNGMPPFRGRITDTQGKQLTAYVRSMSGQASRDAATSRDEHLKSSPPENSSDRLTPSLDPNGNNVESPR